MISLIESALDDYLHLTDCREKTVIEAMRYSLLGGGKRIRAKLVLLFAEAFGGDIQKAIPFACAVEMVHAYSLIHDDLPCMDDDDLRRGKPSCHIQFDYATALLAGDALQSLAFEVLTMADLADNRIVAATKILSQNIGCHGMVGGQTIDLMFEGKDCDISVLEDIEIKKTGALIKAACLLGCVAADATPEQYEAAEQYAVALGRAFQIHDDILDVTSSVEELGKPIGSDNSRNKSTFVSVMGIDNARKAVEELTDIAIKTVEDFSQPLKELAVSLKNRNK